MRCSPCLRLRVLSGLRISLGICARPARDAPGCARLTRIRRFVSQTIVAILKCALLPKRPPDRLCPLPARVWLEQLEAWQSELLR